jgi:cysteinyl-tRNA synthetase
MGGVEHIPVHHTNEIAQSECANGVEFAHYWLHNEHLNVNNAKMAKSEGTSYSLADITDKGYDPLVLRYFFLQAQYRSKQNFTWEALDAARTALNRLRVKVADLFASLPGSDVELPEPNAEFSEKFTAAISDDFNIPQGLAIAWEVANSTLPVAEKLSTILDLDEVLGLQLESSAEDPREAEIPVKAQELLDQRAKARVEKDWQQSDELRDRLLAEFELVVEDGAGGQKVKPA